MNNLRIASLAITVFFTAVFLLLSTGQAYAQQAGFNWDVVNQSQQAENDFQLLSVEADASEAAATFGQVERFNWSVRNKNNTEIASSQTTNPVTYFSENRLTPGEVYTLRVAFFETSTDENPLDFATEQVALPAISLSGEYEPDFTNGTVTLIAEIEPDSAQFSGRPLPNIVRFYERRTEAAGGLQMIHEDDVAPYEHSVNEFTYPYFAQAVFFNQESGQGATITSNETDVTNLLPEDETSPPTEANFGYQIDEYEVTLDALEPSGPNYESTIYNWQWDPGNSEAIRSLGSGSQITADLSGGEGEETVRLQVNRNDGTEIATVSKNLFIGQGDQRQGDTDGDGNPDEDSDGDRIYDPVDDCPDNPDPECESDTDDENSDDESGDNNSGDDPSEYEPLEGGLVVCDNSDGNECGWTALVDQVSRLISWLIMILTIAATLIFIYAGFIYLTSGGSSSQAEKAKNVLQNVVVGFVIVLLAWVIISTLLSFLVDNNSSDGYNWWDDWGSQVVPIDLNF